MYLAYKLSKLHPDCPLTIIEKTDRLGGRVLTKTKMDQNLRLEQEDSVKIIQF